MNGDYWIDLTLSEDETYAMITVQMKRNSWMGLALGTKGMDAGTDMILIDSKEEKVYDMISVGWKPPIAKPTQALVAGFRDVDSDLVTATIKRNLDTGDDKDYVMPKDAAFTIGWSIRTADNNKQAKHDLAGGMTVNFASAAKTKVVKMGEAFGESDDDHEDHDDHDHDDHDDHEHDSAMTSSPLMATSMAMTAVILSQF